MIAALFVHKGGAYFGLPDVDPWDEALARAIREKQRQEAAEAQRRRDTSGKRLKS